MSKIWVKFNDLSYIRVKIQENGKQIDLPIKDMCKKYLLQIFNFFMVIFTQQGSDYIMRIEWYKNPKIECNTEALLNKTLFSKSFALCFLITDKNLIKGDILNIKCMSTFQAIQELFCKSFDGENITETKDFSKDIIIKSVFEPTKDILYRFLHDKLNETAIAKIDSIIVIPTIRFIVLCRFKNTSKTLTLMQLFKTTSKHKSLFAFFQPTFSPKKGVSFYKK